jgi:hypothetical protein|tara:strand:- start:208 stop:672 length:465 start_codon:yes stop_codon:yes gene_type:complete
MAISSAICDTFKEELMKGGHNFNTSGGTPAGNAFKIALYDNSATMGSTTTVYSASDEVSGSGYSAGGNALTNTGVAKSTSTTYTDFSDTSWTSASFTANGCLIYNTTAVTGFTTNRAVCVIAFGGDKTVSSGTFTIQFPTNDSSSAIIRLSGGV